MTSTQVLSDFASALASGAVEVVDLTAPLGPETPLIKLGVGWIDGDRPTWPAEPVIAAWAYRRPLFARQSIGLTQREDGETLADVVAALGTQARSRQRLLEAEGPTAESTRPTAAGTCVRQDQRPRSLGVETLECSERHLGVKRCEERGNAILDRSRGIIIEDRVGEIRGLTPFPTPLNNGTLTSPDLPMS